MKKIAVFSAFVALFFACSHQNDVEQVPQGYRASQTAAPENAIDSASAWLVADTIIYDVMLKNPDPTDEWTSQCLKNVDTQQIVNWVFENVYAGKLQAYSYADMLPLTVEQVKAFEQDTANVRKKIAKMQFEESWYLDTKTMQMVKRVNAIMLAYAINPAEGRYRAGIKVLMPNAKTKTAPSDSAKVAAK